MDNHDALIKSIIGCACAVGRELGTGFPKEIYANALAVETRKAK